MPLLETELKTRINDLGAMPTLPGVVQLVISLVEDEQSSTQDISALISQDQVLSAKLLRMVNSPFYGFPGRISSVSHALVLLGFNVVKGLVLSTAVFEELGRSLEGLWEHSLGVALLSRHLSRELSLREADEIMLAGLLHDLGKVVMAYLDPEGYQEVVTYAREKGCTIREAEGARLGYDHTEVAGWVGEAWRLPPRLLDSLQYHHNPGAARVSTENAAIIQLADILARGMGYGDSGDSTMPPIDAPAFESLQLYAEQIDLVLNKAEWDYLSGLELFKQDLNTNEE